MLLLTLPQLVSGGIYCYAAWRYGLRASILAHMISNALLREPLFETWLNFVVGAVP